MSYHGSKAWYADFSHFNRHFSVMYCGKYALLDKAGEEQDIYIAYNMYWENQEFGVPSVRNKKKWHLEFSTDGNKKDCDIDRMYEAPGRSISVLVAGDENK